MHCLWLLHISALCGGSIGKWRRSKWWRLLYLIHDGNDFICSKLPNEAGLKTTTATQGDSSWERNVHCMGASRLKSIWEFFTLIWEFTAPWEFCVESIYGSFSPLYGSAAVNALQFGDKVHTLCSADNTSWYVQYQYQYCGQYQLICTIPIPIWQYQLICTLKYQYQYQPIC